MSGANLTPLLLEARDAGLSLRADQGDLVVWPVVKLTPELREELVRYKPALLELLTWRESDAHVLLQDAMAYLSEFYLETGMPDCSLADLNVHESAIDAAFHDRDMFALRIALREWVQAGVGMFKARERDRGAA